MHPWIPVVVTVALGLIGLAIQACLLAFFIGKMREQQAGQERLVNVFREFTEKAIDAMMTRLGRFDEIAAESQADRATLNAKLSVVERNTDGLQGLREAMAAHAATFGAHRERQEADMEKLNRAMEGVQRQLATLATKGPGAVVEWAADSKR